MVYGNTITEEDARARARAEAMFWYTSLPLFGLDKAPLESQETQWALREYENIAYRGLVRRYGLKG